MSLDVLRRCVAATLLVAALAACDGGSPGSSGTPGPSANPPVGADRSGPSPSAATSAPSIGPTAGDTGPTGGGATGPTGASAGTGATPRPHASPQGVQLVKTGGIAGVNETVTVKPDGSWYRIDGKRNTKASGKLTDAQMAALQQLLTDPKLLTEGGKAGSGHCADGFEYLLVVEYRLIHYTACGQGTKPEVTLKIIGLLQSATKGQ